ncbi:hypothetical protein RJ641_013670, partial [Dillenia turbinata]
VPIEPLRRPRRLIIIVNSMLSSQGLSRLYASDQDRVYAMERATKVLSRSSCPVLKDFPWWMRMDERLQQRLTAGWRGFSLDHELADGDALVFQLIDHTIFKVSCLKTKGFFVNLLTASENYLYK